MGQEHSRTILKHSRTRGMTTFVFTIIAIFMNGDGEAYPSVALIAKLARISERQVQEHISAIEALGELVCDRRGGRRVTSRYRFNMPVDPSPSFDNATIGCGVPDPLPDDGVKGGGNPHPFPNGAKGCGILHPLGQERVKNPVEKGAVKRQKG